MKVFPQPSIKLKIIFRRWIDCPLHCKLRLFGDPDGSAGKRIAFIWFGKHLSRTKTAQVAVYQLNDSNLNKQQFTLHDDFMKFMMSPIWNHTHCESYLDS